MNLEREIVTGYTMALQKTKRSKKGIKMAYLPLTNIVFQLQPVKCITLAKNYTISRGAMANRLNRGIENGYIEKNGFYYSVTPYGKMISEELSKNFAPHLARIKAQLLAELREQL